MDKTLLIQLFMGMQNQMVDLTNQVQELNAQMQKMMKQLILSNKSRFGRSSEKMSDPEQIRFMEVDGTIVFFNEAEAVCDLDALERITSQNLFKRLHGYLCYGCLSGLSCIRKRAGRSDD